MISPTTLATRSSSPDLSSPPSDLDADPSPTSKLLSLPKSFDPAGPNSSRVGGNSSSSTAKVKVDGGVEGNSSATSAAITRTPSSSSAVANIKNTTTSTTTTTSVRRSRKKDQGDDNPKSSKKIKTQSTSTPATAKPPRKRPSKNSDATKDTKRTLLPSRQPKITTLVGSSQNNNTDNNKTPPIIHSLSSKSENGNSEAIQLPSVASLTITNNQETPARTSGTKYDPIRSVNLEHTNSDLPPSRPKTPSQDRPTNSASASPSISSLIDPPVKSFAHSHPLARFVSNTTETASTIAPSSPSATIQVAQPVHSATKSQSKPPTSADKEVNGGRDDHPMQEPSAATSKTTKKVSPKSTTANSPAAVPSPKPTRRRELPAPPPSGSGLLSSIMFGGLNSASSQTSAENRPTIVLDIQVNCEADRYVHFPKLVEERYGPGVLDVSMTAQKDRSARIAAAAAALERQLGVRPADEMSEDMTDSDSNVEMGGTGNSGDGEEEEKPKRKRRAKDEYDKNDPFVDDSDMIFIEQATSSKDGFFVYEGPLIPAVETSNIERADGTAKRSRTSGGGSRVRGGQSRANGSSRAAGASGSGAGSKGSGAARKPRITKADRTRMEQEKQERERMAVLAAKPSTYAG